MTSTIERKYKDAKRISEEIKTLTEEGEVKQQQILTLEKNIKSQKEELSANTVLLDKAKNAFEKNLKNHGKCLRNCNRKIKISEKKH